MPRRVFAVVSDEVFADTLETVKRDKREVPEWDMAHALAALVKAYSTGRILRVDLLGLGDAYDEAQAESDAARRRSPRLRDIEG